MQELSADACNWLMWKLEEAHVNVWADLVDVESPLVYLESAHVKVRRRSSRLRSLSCTFPENGQQLHIVLRVPIVPLCNHQVSSLLNFCSSCWNFSISTFKTIAILQTSSFRIIIICVAYQHMYLLQLYTHSWCLYD